MTFQFKKQYLIHHNLNTNWIVNISDNNTALILNWVLHWFLNFFDYFPFHNFLIYLNSIITCNFWRKKLKTSKPHSFISFNVSFGFSLMELSKYNFRNRINILLISKLIQKNTEYLILGMGQCLCVINDVYTMVHTISHC